MLVWPWISLEREISWSWILRTRSRQYHNNPVLVPPRKPPDPMKDLYDGHIYNLKTRVYIRKRMDVVPVEYGTLSQKIYLMMWLFRFITGIDFNWYYMMWRIIALLIWINLRTKWRIYRVPPDPVRWSCQVFGSLWKVFMMSWMILFKNKLKVSHRN